MGGGAGAGAFGDAVILLPRAVRVYFATAPANLRKSFDGLSNEVRSVLGRDPLSGHVFVFLNKRKNQVKLLLWTRGGFTIVHKRLERGTFTFSGAGHERGHEHFDRCARAVDAARGNRPCACAHVCSLGTAGARTRVIFTSLREFVCAQRSRSVMRRGERGSSDDGGADGQVE
jgi:transposase